MKVFIAFVFTIFITISDAQIVDTNNIIDDMQVFYASLNQDNLTTDYFFNKGFILHNELVNAELDVPIIANYRKWKYMYSEIVLSNINNAIGSNNILSDIIDRDTTAVVYLPIFFFKGNYLDGEQVSELLIDNELDPDYKEITIFSGATSKQSVGGLSVDFVFNDSILFTNISDSFFTEINFGDGNGYHSLSSNHTFNIQYDCYGEKSITFKMIRNQDTLVSYSSLNIFYKSNIIPTYTSNVFTNKSEPIGYYGNYEYYEGCDNELDKPVIIAEGFDLMGLESAADYYRYWENTIERLRNKGYDVYTLNFQAPDHRIENNAEVVKLLIKDIIDEDRTGDIYEGIYI